jgi:hypothetical protein
VVDHDAVKVERCFGGHKNQGGPYAAVRNDFGETLKPTLRCHRRVELEQPCSRFISKQYPTLMLGLQIPAIENLASHQGTYDTLNLTDNSITSLGNIPLCQLLPFVTQLVKRWCWLMPTGLTTSTTDKLDTSSSKPNIIHQPFPTS